MRPWLAMGLLLAGCGQPTSHRSPAFQGAPTPKPTLLTGAVPCLDSAVVVAGGQLVRRATGFGKEAVQRVNNRVARIGQTAPALPSSVCRDLTSERAKSSTDWLAPEAPSILVELAQMSGAQTVFVPVVRSEMECGRKTGPWWWGKPAYEDDRGDVDCVETKLTFMGYLFDAQGSVLWKAVHEHEVREVPDSAKLANELMFEAPIRQAVPLSPGSSG
jgi:hypothetical protein